MTRPALAELQDAVKLAISREGLRPLAARAGVPIGLLRGASSGRNLAADSIGKLADALGLEFYVGPPRHDRTSTHDGAIDHSAEMSIARRCPERIRARLRLPEGATEADALAALDALPDGAHDLLARLSAGDAALRTLDAIRALIREAGSGVPSDS